MLKQVVLLILIIAKLLEIWPVIAAAEYTSAAAR